MIINRVSGRVKDLYIVSRRDDLDKELVCPDKSNKIPKISLFDSISDALGITFLGLKLTGKFYVYRALGIRNENLLAPDITMAPYLLCLDKREWWYTLPLYVEKECEIEVRGIKEERQYRQGEKQRISKVYIWNWKRNLKSWEKMKLKKKLYGETAETVGTLGAGTLGGLVLANEAGKLTGEMKAARRLSDHVRNKVVKDASGKVTTLIQKPGSLRDKAADKILHGAEKSGKVLKRVGDFAKTKGGKAGIVAGTAIATTYVVKRKDKKKKGEK